MSEDKELWEYAKKQVKDQSKSFFGIWMWLCILLFDVSVLTFALATVRIDLIAFFGGLCGLNIAYLIGNLRRLSRATNNLQILVERESQ